VKVIIPVAGEGTRLRPHTFSAPKPLLSVAGKPILAHVLDPVLPLKPEEVIFVVGYKGDMIEQWVRANYSFPVRFVAQDKLLGLGYAVNMAMPFVTDEPLLIILGDTIVQCDLEDFTSYGDYVLGVRKVEDPKRFGIAVLKDGTIVDLEEKPERPKSDLAVIGLYYFKHSAPFKKALNDHVVSGHTVRGEIQLTDALHDLIERGETCLPYEVTAWYDCGKRETMIATNRHLLDQMESGALEGATIVPPVYIDQEVVAKNATIGPYVSLARGARIINSEISHAIVGSDTTIENSHLNNSLVGNNVSIYGASGQLNVGDWSEIDLR
jgi:glucose-1-phosphate thymidylyltransferase